jgi:hypothetical protein
VEVDRVLNGSLAPRVLDWSDKVLHHRPCASLLPIYGHGTQELKQVILEGMLFTEAELKKAVVHLAFDVHHFRCYVELHETTNIRQICPAASQAVVYSLLLHLRLLLDFFYGPAKKDDCCVEHFRVLTGFSAAFPPNIVSPTPSEARQVSMNLHKRLAHLTATRWKERAPSMDFYQKYFDTVDKLIGKFEAALPDDVRAIFLSELHRWENNTQPSSDRGNHNCGPHAYRPISHR